MMGASSNIEDLFLHGDDIEGIRALSLRDGFNHDWPQEETFPDVTAKKSSDVSLLKINKATAMDGNQLEVTYSIVTSVPTRYYFQIKEKNSQRWQSLQNYYLKVELCPLAPQLYLA